MTTSNPKPCPACDGRGESLDYSPVQFAMVPRKCPLCGGTGLAPGPKRHVPDPSQSIGLAAKTYAGYVSACREAGMKVACSNTWSTWRKRAGTVQKRYLPRPE